MTSSEWGNGMSQTGRQWGHMWIKLSRTAVNFLVALESHNNYLEI